MNMKILILALLLLLVVASCDNGDKEGLPTPYFPQPTNPNEDSLSWDAQGYAALFDISTEEALRRFELQDLAGTLGASLAEREEATFAGLWLEHTPDFRVIVQFTRDGESTIKPYLQGSVLTDAIELRIAEVSLAKLEEVQAETLSSIRRGGILADSGINVRENRVELYVTDRRQLDNPLPNGWLELSPRVNVIVVEELSKPVVDITEESLPTPYFLQPANPTAERMTAEPVGEEGLPTPYFPQLAAPMSERMMALLEGELVLVDGCIRVDDGYSSPLLIWPHGFRVEVEGEVVRVWDDTDRLVGMVGEPVTMGGGEYPIGDIYERHVEKLIGEPPSDNCPGPFWLVGDTHELAQ